MRKQQKGSYSNSRIILTEVRRVIFERIRSLGGEEQMHWGHEVSEVKRRDTDGKISVNFTNGVKVEGIDLLVGADGVRSKTLSLCLSAATFPPKIASTISPDPEPLGILLIIGVSTLDHPLLRQRGFHSVNGSTRLFLMPFSEGETMWQFSCALPNEEGTKLRRLGASELKKHVQSMMSDWHSPIPALLEETDIDTIWGTTLVDRDPSPFCCKGEKNDIIFIGDAAHAMSPFKGAGANQALLDGVQLVEHLVRGGGGKVRTSALNFERIMIQRSRVKDSRLAAIELHSERVLNASAHAFTGLSDEQWAGLSEVLEKRGIRASEGIDENIRDSMADLGIEFEATVKTKKKKSVDEEDVQTMFRAVQDGDFPTIRRLSLKDSRLLSLTTLDGANLKDLAKKKEIRKWFINDVGLR